MTLSAEDSLQDLVQAVVAEEVASLRILRKQKRTSDRPLAQTHARRPCRRRIANADAVSAQCAEAQNVRKCAKRPRIAAEEETTEPLAPTGVLVAQHSSRVIAMRGTNGRSDDSDRSLLGSQSPYELGVGTITAVDAAQEKGEEVGPEKSECDEESKNGGPGEGHQTRGQTDQQNEAGRKSEGGPQQRREETTCLDHCLRRESESLQVKGSSPSPSRQLTAAELFSIFQLLTASPPRDDREKEERAAQLAMLGRVAQAQIKRQLQRLAGCTGTAEPVPEAIASSVVLPTGLALAAGSSPPPAPAGEEDDVWNSLPDSPACSSIPLSNPSSPVSSNTSSPLYPAGSSPLLSPVPPPPTPAPPPSPERSRCGPGRFCRIRLHVCAPGGRQPCGGGQPSFNPRTAASHSC